MRAAVLFAAGAALAQASSDAPTLTVIECDPLSSASANSSTAPSINTTAIHLPTAPNATVTTDIIVPSETSGDPAIPTAGAISQPLQSSIVGLLGFVVVGLIWV